MEDKFCTATFTPFGRAKIILSTNHGHIDVRAVLYEYHELDPSQIRNGRIIFGDFDKKLYVSGSDNELHIMFVNECGKSSIYTLKGVQMYPNEDSKYNVHNFTATKLAKVESTPDA